MSPAKPLVYLILGAAGSGRREIVADLIEGGLGDGDRPAAFLAAGEASDAHDEKLGPLTRWSWTEGRIEAPAPDGASHVFFFADGRRNPVDQVEAFKSWLEAAGGGLARVICVVHCRLAAEHKELLEWYDACVHFADVVLLNRREDVPNKWLAGFPARYTARFYPCVIEPVKSGRVNNPALILEPQARRMSHYFDDELNWEVSGGGDEDERPDEIVAAPEEDPWLQRRAGGRRVKELPDIAKYLA